MTENEKLRALLAEARESVEADAETCSMLMPKGTADKLQNLLYRIDEALAQPAAQTSQYDKNLSACHRYGLCADPKQELNAFDKIATKNCSVCPRK